MKDMARELFHFSGLSTHDPLLPLVTGLLGLGHVEVVPRKRTSVIPDAVRQEIDRFKTLYDGFHYRELARILSITFGTPIDHKTVKALWQASPVACQGHLALWDYHTQPDRYQARLQVIQLYYRGAPSLGSTGGRSAGGRRHDRHRRDTLPVQAAEGR
jgi:hypothetical protein